MQPEYETIDTFEQDGWAIDVAVAPDWDYRPGEDDDIYPRFETVDAHWDYDERDLDGRYIERPIIVDSRQGPLKVTPEEISRLIELAGGDPRRMRKQIESDARAIAGEMLTWVDIRVTATRGTITGTDYLGGVEWDTRSRQVDGRYVLPETYVLETVEHYAMAEQAIEDAARSTLGSLATQALGI